MTGVGLETARPPLDYGNSVVSMSETFVAAPAIGIRIEGRAKIGCVEFDVKARQRKDLGGGERRSGRP